MKLAILILFLIVILQWGNKEMGYDNNTYMCILGLLCLNDQKFIAFQKGEYRDGIKSEGDKIGMAWS